MFVDYVMQICDRIMRETVEHNTSHPSFSSDSPEVNSAPLKEPDCHNPTVLLVEDHPVLLESLHFALQQAGYNVITANSGESALAICHTHTGAIHILVSDIQMGQITGFDVAAAVKAVHPNAIVVLMSGSPLSSFRQHMTIHDFLEKPFAHKKLLTTISRHTATKVAQE